MKKFRRKPFFRKMDEMEQSIVLRAQRNSYLFLVLALGIWSMYESCRVFIHHSRLNLLPCLLLTAAAVIQSFSQLIMTRNAVKGDEDSCETGPLMKIFALTCAVAGIVATVLTALLLMGVPV